jgi:hypothetical protein
VKRILYSLLVATLPFGSVLAGTPKEKNAKVDPRLPAAMPRHSAAGHDAEAARYVDAGPGLGIAHLPSRASTPGSTKSPNS